LIWRQLWLLEIIQTSGGAEISNDFPVGMGRHQDQGHHLFLDMKVKWPPNG
jgi:hypothetical protein